MNLDKVWSLQPSSLSVHFPSRGPSTITTVTLDQAVFGQTTWMIDTTLSSTISSISSKSNGQIKQEWVKTILISGKMNSNLTKSDPRIPITLPTLNGQPQELILAKVGYLHSRVRIASQELLEDLGEAVVVDQLWMSQSTKATREAVIATFSQSQLPIQSLCTKLKVKMIHCSTTFHTESSMVILRREGSVPTSNTQEAVRVSPIINNITRATTTRTLLLILIRIRMLATSIKPILAHRGKQVMI